MKKGLTQIFAAAVFCMAAVAAASPVVVENWSVLDSSNAGTYMDTNGSSVTFSTVDGKKKNEKALQLKSSLKSGGYCGLWHVLNAEVGQAGALVFIARSDKAGDVQIALKDKNNVQYTTTFTVLAGSWTGVTLNLSSFKKDPYYTPPDAVTGKDVDFSTLKGMNVSSQIVGDSVLCLGPIKADGKFQAAAPKAVEAAPEGVLVENWASGDTSNMGAYTDSNGSQAKVETVEGPASGEKALKIAGELKTGGYLGAWHNLKANLAGVGFLRFKAKGETAGAVQISLKDKYNVEYVASFEVGKEWAEVLVPLSDLKKNPYYTPPDAVTGKDMDLSETKSMNFAPQTPGPVAVQVGPVQAVSAKK
jgi:hypothetical protein